MDADVLPPPPLKNVEAMRDYLLAHGALNAGMDFPLAGHAPAAPAYIPNAADENASGLQCWFNVKKLVVQHKGTAIFGWAIWESVHDGRDCLVAQPHAVFLPEGEERPVCTTPLDAVYADHTILFMADPRIGFDYDRIPLRQPPMLLRFDETLDEGKRFVWVKPTTNGYISLSPRYGKPDNYHFLYMEDP